MKRHNLDKNKNAAALKCDGDLRNASSLPFASQHRLQDNWTHFQGHCGVIHLFEKRESEQPEQNHTRAIGQSKTAFVTLRFTFFLRYLLQLLFFCSSRCLFRVLYDKKELGTKIIFMYGDFRGRWHRSGASWCNELEAG
jgi:hypothetical protein